MVVSQLKISYYKNLLLSMTVAKSHGAINIAKPVLLLAIFDGIERVDIQGTRILYCEQLITRYNAIFQQYREAITPPVYPYYYLDSEEFYYIKGAKAKTTPSAKFLREHVEYASLDDDLWTLLQDAVIRDEFKEAIIKHYIKSEQ